MQPAMRACIHPSALRAFGAPCRVTHFLCRVTFVLVKLMTKIFYANADNYMLGPRDNTLLRKLYIMFHRREADFA